MRERLRFIVDDQGSRVGRIFSLFVQILVLISVIGFSVETLPDLEPATREFLHQVELVTITLFSFEYLLRLWVAEKRLGFVFSFFGMVDLLAILPFYLSLGVDLRSVRAVRMVRLVRLFKLMRYSKALHRFALAFTLIKDELAIFMLSTLLLLYLAAVGIYYFENPAQPEHFKSVFHCLWWAVATLTTVGYGDIIPITIGGRIFTFVILMIGLGIIAVPAGLISAAMNEAVREETLNKKKKRNTTKTGGEDYE